MTLSQNQTEDLKEEGEHHIYDVTAVAAVDAVAAGVSARAVTPVQNSANSWQAVAISNLLFKSPGIYACQNYQKGNPWMIFYLLFLRVAKMAWPICDKERRVMVILLGLRIQIVFGQD